MSSLTPLLGTLLGDVSIRTSRRQSRSFFQSVTYRRRGAFVELIDLVDRLVVAFLTMS